MNKRPNDEPAFETQFKGNKRYDTSRLTTEFLNSEDCVKRISETVNRIENELSSNRCINEAYGSFTNFLMNEMDLAGLTVTSPIKYECKSKQSKAKTFLKPYWSDLLQQKWDAASKKEKLWLKCSDHTNIKRKLKQEYCAARNDFDKHLRKAKRTYQNKLQMDLMTELEKPNSRDFWKQIGKIGISNDRRDQIPWEVIDDNGEVTTDKERVLQKWKTDYQTLFNDQTDSIKYDATKKGTDAGITFANWMGFAFLLSLIMLIISWFWIQLLFIRCGCLHKANRSRSKAIKTAIDQEFKKLGKITFAEVTVLIVFICLAILWIFRDLPDIHGWSLAFKTKYVSDSTASILMACLLFILPAEIPNVFCWNKISSTTNEYEKPTYRPILNWQVTNQKVPWGVLVLLGGGFALADASQISGLSKWLSCELSSINEYEPWIINLIICCVVAGATEVTSNTATATLLLPIMFDLAIGLNLHPLYMMISVCIACSFAFMLPVATPPNAIVFSTGYLKIYDMVFAGIVMNIIGIAVLTLAVNTWAEPIFGLDTIPEMFQNMSSSTNKACIQLCPN
ncbi:SLC13A2_3_5 [Mytilus edulis]|uniref:SLC13A2_3_5 n=1 Tax=Mytilus edulis TaxID=6550 RepID=A0A8S3PVL2_MYTED|nr:SLC13A2_3_5 [Mytilus edulis]